MTALEQAAVDMVRAWDAEADAYHAALGKKGLFDCHDPRYRDAVAARKAASERFEQLTREAMATP